MLYLIVLSLLIYYMYSLWNTYSYWRRKGVIGPTPLPIVGNFFSVLFWKNNEADLLQHAYHEYPNEKCVGLYRGTTPILLIRDPEMIKQILVKDYESFFGKVLFAGASNYSKSMSGTNDYEIWKILRTSFSPTLTKSKVAKTMPLSYSPLAKYIRFVDKMADQSIDHDVSFLQRKFALEIVGAMTLGKELGSFSSDNHIEMESHKYNQRFFTQKMLYKVAIVFPVLLKLVMPIIHGFIRTMYRFYYGIIIAIVNERARNGKSQNSFLDYMTDIKGKKHETQRGKFTIDDAVIVQQCVITWIVNYVNTANATALTLHELAHNQHVQDKAREEIDEVMKKYNGEINIDAVSEFKYLDMVLDEALRKYTTNGVLTRVCSAKYTFPDTNLTVDKGVLVYVSLQGLHHDPKYFPNPQEFDPERFAPENKILLPKCAYMAFGDGPRNCVGQRLAKVVLMLGLVPFLHKFKVFPPQGKKLRPWPYRLGENVPGGVWLTIRRREQT